MQWYSSYSTTYTIFLLLFFFRSSKCHTPWSMYKIAYGMRNCLAKRKRSLGFFSSFVSRVVRLLAADAAMKGTRMTRPHLRQFRPIHVVSKWLGFVIDVRVSPSISRNKTHSSRTHRWMRDFYFHSSSFDLCNCFCATAMSVVGVFLFAPRLPSIK